MTTITHAAILAAVETIPEHAYPSEDADHIARALGVEVPVSEPPAEMVKLAREIAERTPGLDDDYDARKRAAFVTLQHVQRAVDGLSWRSYESVPEFARDVLRVVGAGGRDAG